MSSFIKSPTNSNNNKKFKTIKSSIEWKKSGYSRGADKYLHFSSDNSKVSFNDINSKPKSTMVGGIDYLIVRTRDYVNKNERMIINCFIESKGDEMWIGLMLANKYADNKSLRWNSSAVTYCENGSIQYFGRSYSKNIAKYNSGDKITFDLFLSKDTGNTYLKVFKNGEFIADLKSIIGDKIHQIINQKTYFVVEVDAAYDTVHIEKMLLCPSNSNVDDSKSNETEIAKLKRELPLLKTFANEKLANQEKQMISLRNENDSTQDTNLKLQATIHKLKKQNKTLLQQQQEYKSSLQSLKNKVSSLEDERKEFEMTINELRQENKTLKLQNINTDNYETWTVDEIVYWIVSLDPNIYGQYKEILARLLKEEDVNGECLKDVDIADIKRWGIKSFKHSKQLLKEIILLTENKKNNKNSEIMNEGANAPTAYL